MYALLSRAFDRSVNDNDIPPSYKGVALGGVGTGVLQSLFLCPVELVKIQLQLQTKVSIPPRGGPIDVVRSLYNKQGIRGLYRGLGITMMRDAPAHGVYFWTYEYMREQLHPGCRKSGQQSFGTMLVAGGLAGVSSWICCYPLDVVKTRLQMQAEIGSSVSSTLIYDGIMDCFIKSVREDGYRVLWRGLGTALSRAFLVNAAIFSAYEMALRCCYHGTQPSR